MNKKFFFTILILKNFYLLGAIGCMDNSKHTYIGDGYDYKNYYFVRCNCPCERYQQLPERGKCMKCSHYGDSSNLIFGSPSAPI